MFVAVFGRDCIIRISSTVKRAVQDAVAQGDRSMDFPNDVKEGLAFAWKLRSDFAAQDNKHSREIAEGEKLQTWGRRPGKPSETGPSAASNLNAAESQCSKGAHRRLREIQELQQLSHHHENTITALERPEVYGTNSSSGSGSRHQFKLWLWLWPRFRRWLRWFSVRPRLGLCLFYYWFRPQGMRGILKMMESPV